MPPRFNDLRQFLAFLEERGELVRVREPVDPALEIAENLAATYRGRISVVEPFIDGLPSSLSEHGVRKIDLDHALKEAGILIVLVDHEAFRRVSSHQRNGAVIYDTRGIWRR